MSGVGDACPWTLPARGNIPTGTPRGTDQSNIVDTPKTEASSWENRRSVSDFLVFSNVIYVVIGAVYATKGRPVVAALVTLSGLTSFVYHVSRETAAGQHARTHDPPAHASYIM